MDLKGVSLPLRRQDGFTINELLVTLAIVTLVFGLSATALRQFWLTRSLQGAADEVVTQLRQLQEEAISQSHPQVFGAVFRAGSSNWELIEYDPTGGGSGTASCTEEGTRTFEGPQVSAVDFGTAPSDVATTCSIAGGEEVVLFYARGTATAGSLTLVHPSISGRSRTVTVTPLTGRVTQS